MHRRSERIKFLRVKIVTYLIHISEKNNDLIIIIKMAISVVINLDFRKYEYEIEDKNDFFNSRFAVFTLSHHIPISFHELHSLPKTNMKSEGSGNVTGLKHKSEIHGTRYALSFHDFLRRSGLRFLWLDQKRKYLS